MSQFKQRSDYFKTIAHKNKLISHDRPIEDGSIKLRKSFHRINDEDELNAACSQWAHFPCVVHIGNDINYKQLGTGLPRKVTNNHLYFLTKVANPLSADAIEAAYDEAYTTMSQFINFMLHDLQQMEGCGELFLLDLNRSKSEMIGPINTTLFGWYLSFEDEQRATEFLYDEDSWITD